MLRLLPFDDCAPELVRDALSLQEPVAPAMTHAWLMRRLFGDISFVALRGDTPAGVILACIERRHPDHLYIEKVAVDAALRRHGVARALVGRAASVAAAQGCRQMWLTTDPANPACHAWLRMGFTADAGAEGAHGWPVTRDLKGRALDRAVFRRTIE